VKRAYFQGRSFGDFPVQSDLTANHAKYAKPKLFMG